MTMRTTALELGSRATSLTLAAALLAPSPALLGSSTARAAAPEAEAEAPAEGPEEAPAEEDPTLAEAKAKFEAGAARYTAADYGAAIDLWLEAYALLPATVDNQFIKAQLIYNVARAQQKWFDIDQDIKHLRQSREILVRYADELDALYEPSQAAIEREKIEDQIGELDAQIAEWEAEQRRREAELAERMRPTFDFEADAREEKRNKAMLGAGATLTLLGLGGGVMILGGSLMAKNAEEQIGNYPTEADVLEREGYLEQGVAGNALMIVGTLSASIFLTAGLPLVGVGAAAEKKRRQRRRDAGVEDVAQVRAVGPMVLPQGGGLSLSGRF